MNLKKPSFVTRKKARRHVLQALYGWLLSDNDISTIERYVLEEHAEEDFDREYFKELLHDIPKQVHGLDSLMSPFLSRKLEDLSPVELTILRISIYELKERTDIPYKVVINEGLELAKTFAASDSHKFVNGVLDKVAKQLRASEIQ